MFDSEPKKVMTPEERSAYENSRDLMIDGLDGDRIDRMAFMMDLAHCYESALRGRAIDADILNSLREDYARLLSSKVVDLEAGRIMQDVEGLYIRQMVANRAIKLSS